LGSAELSVRAAVQAVYPDLAPTKGDSIEPKRAVIGLAPGQSFERAPCCQPLPGERIVGLTQRGKGVVVHSIDCPTLAAYEDQPDRWLDLHWHSGSHPAAYTVTLDLTIGNDAGVLGRICTLIGEQKANISDMKFVDRKPDFYRLLIGVDLRDAEHLHSVVTALAAESDVAAISRRRDSFAGQSQGNAAE
jgi:GTP pyrophosphokinase/guanosine-3',5'-bis(diphosphate) 3'-pyrophosphohydrolase